MLVVLILNLVDLKSVVVEQDRVFRVKTISQVVSVENGLKLSEELK